MTNEEMEAVFDRVRTWPAERQRDVIATLTRMEELDSGSDALTDEERADLEDGLREAERGEFASDEEIAAIFARYRG